MRPHPHVRLDRNVAGSPTDVLPNLATVKTHLRVDYDDDDSYITAIRLAARDYIEDYCDVKFGSFSHQAFWDYAYPVVLVPAIATSFSNVELRKKDGSSYTAVDSTKYEVDDTISPMRVHMKQMEGTGPELNLYRLSYTTSVTSVPEYVKQAFLMICGHFYENRQDVGNDRVYEVPMTSRHLLNRYREMTF